jgi:hypothetical protein
LRYGADPDLADEDAKTPLDKAKERSDKGHKDVAQLLQTPGEWMAPVSPPTSSDEDSDASTEEEIQATAKRPIIEAAGGSTASDVAITDIASGEAIVAKETKEESVLASTSEISAASDKQSVLESDILPAKEAGQLPRRNQERITAVEQTVQITPESTDQPTGEATSDTSTKTSQEEMLETASSKEQTNETSSKETMQGDQETKGEAKPEAKEMKPEIKSEPEETKPEVKPEPYDQHGDPEMAPIYLKHLLPIFTHIYQKTMLPSVQKASFALIRKMVHYGSETVLTEIAGMSAFMSEMTEVIANVLEKEVCHVICEV